jgi:TRAP-type mannitol/chloroaromatic compound transport system permease small subunit
LVGTNDIITSRGKEAGMIEKVRRILKVVDAANEKMARIDAYVLLLAMFLVPYEVVVRYVFNSPTSWSMEMTQFLFCTMVALGGGWVLLKGSHVNVDIIYNRFGIRTRAIISILTSLLVFVFLYLVFRQNLSEALRSLSWRETSASGWNPPLYPIKFIIPLGVLFLLLQSIAMFIRYILQAVTGVEEIKIEPLTGQE